MKVIHISSSDSVGGAAIAAYRLHSALIAAGVESIFIAAEKSSDDVSVIQFPFGKYARKLLAVIDAIKLQPYKTRNRSYPYTVNWFQNFWLRYKIGRLKPDVLHLHWIGKGIIALSDMPKFKKPIVITMHDNYAFTGGCHLVFDCRNYLDACGNCGMLNSNRTEDLSQIVFKKKKATYQAVKQLNFIAPSAWMYEIAKSSALLKNKELTHLPNLIDCSSFYPVEKKYARQKLGLPLNKKLLLFGALNVLSDPNKGSSKLFDILAQKEMQEKYQLVVFGANSANNSTVNSTVLFTGYLTTDEARRLCYSAADITIVPSKIENLSNVIMESLACGTPVCAFDTGGNSDLIEHKKNGYLAVKNNFQDLVQGIEFVAQENEAGTLSSYAVKTIEEKFSTSRNISSFVQLYQKKVE